MNLKYLAQAGPGLGTGQACFFFWGGVLFVLFLAFKNIPVYFVDVVSSTGMGRTDSTVGQGRTDSRPCHFLAVGLWTIFLPTLNLVCSPV